MAVRVLVIEDNDVFRNALEVLLALDADIEIAGVGAGRERRRRALP